MQIISDATNQGERIDKMLAKQLSGYSRSTVQQWLQAGHVLCNGKKPKAKAVVKQGDVIDINLPEPPALTQPPQPLALDIIYADAAIIVLNKPAGLVVHPGAGNPDGTLLNGLLHYDSRLQYLARGGIVHRLDKDTSGLMVVARTAAAQQHLIAQLAERSVKRHYIALVYGTLIAGGTIDAPLGRHPKQRVKMAVVGNGKAAITHYRIAAKYRHTTKLMVALETGRTHQIRVHLASIRLPLIGDPVYGKRVHIPPAASDELRLALQTFKRQALHAQALGLIHPINGEPLSWQAAMPPDMLALQTALHNDNNEGH